MDVPPLSIKVHKDVYLKRIFTSLLTKSYRRKIDLL